MTQKCLIIYTSLTGNTEKVALRFKSTFERNGWEYDVFKIDKNTDIMNPPFDFDNYDFACVGSGLIMHLPTEEILNVMQKQFFGVDPRILKRNRFEMPDLRNVVPPEARNFNPHGKIILGNAKNAVVFITYAGYEFGPKEAEPALKLLELEIEHLGFRCIGQFCCPGKFINSPTPGTYHGDIRDRPNERDLLKAEMFIEEKLEQIREIPGKSQEADVGEY